MFMRITRLCRAISGAAVGELEAEHADEMLQLERDELHRKVAHYNSGLATHAALCERLKAQVARRTREKEQLESRVRTRLAAADRAAAGSAAVRLEAATSELAELVAQLAQAEDGYQELVCSRQKAVEAAREKIEAFRRSIGECKVQTALAELSETAAGMHGSVGISSGRLERLKERVEDKRDLAAARVRVARDSIDVAESDEDPADAQVRAEEALARFEARSPEEHSAA